MIGTRLAHYDITSHLGSGGMGDVYQATDTKLGRMVAIKVLPEAFARDADRVARFEREARMLATLNHPNIAAIYGFEQWDQGHFVVMELVGGTTLAERIKQGPIPLEEALPIAKQICEALEAAHEKGVIHRDLKPANIKILPDNKVKVLDFGLAKLAQAEAPASSGLSNSPTLSMAATNAGVILGTAAYMSPEQAKGRAVDRRSDIFAFGCVLYEMLTGHPAFDGDDVTEILARVVTREPDWDRLPASVPKRLRELLRLCLQKDLRKRRRDAGDVILDIDQIAAEPSEVSSAPVAQSHLRARLAWIAATVFALVAIVAVALQFRSVPAQPEMRLEITARAMRYPAQFAISPDGLSIVYSASTNGPQQLWLRRLDRVEAQPLMGTEGGGSPFWSPDSRAIGFFASNRLFRLDFDGGPPRPLTDAVLSTGGAWNQNGVIVFSRSLVSPLFRIPSSGGEAVPVTKLDASLYSNRTPRFLPDGKHFLFHVVGRPEVQGVYLGSLDGSAPKLLTPADAHGEYLEPGYVVYISQGVLLARRLNVERGELTGPTETIANSVPYSAAVGLGAFSVSATGRVAYQVGAAARRQLVWYDRKGTAKPAADADVNELQSAELSPDGSRIALDRTVQGNRDIFLFDLLRGNMTRFTFEPVQDGLPVWSPDSTQIVFESKRKGPYDLYLKMASGAMGEKPLLESDNDKWPMDWSKDGSYLMYYENDPKTGGNLIALPMNAGDKKSVVIANSPFEERNGQFSPDGRWVAYETNESRRTEIVVQSFPVPSNKWQVSTNGGIQPRWRRDSTELYFIGPDSKMMAVPIKISGSTLDPAMPVALFQARVPAVPKPQYSISADGRFLINEQVEDPSVNSITLILNWHAKQQ
jgi:eukaryotic-like serine/threonine-protein kinase